MLSPALLTAMIGDGFRLPIPAGASFTAGDVVPLGAGLVGIAANDSGWDGAPTARPSSVNTVGIYDFPATAAIAAGVPVAWDATNKKVVTSWTGGHTTYPLGISITAQAGGTIRVLVWPGSGTTS